MTQPQSNAKRASVTITDVAHAAGVSKSTVSLVLQGSPLIARETAERVRQSAVALGYVYNRRAADLRRKSSNMVGIVINDLGNPFFAEMLVGMERRLVDAGYISLMAHTDERLDVQERVLTSMQEYHAAGLILCPAFDTPAGLLQRTQHSGIPLVIVVREPGTGSYDFVGANHESGTFEVTRHLIGQGHRRCVRMDRRHSSHPRRRPRRHPAGAGDAGPTDSSSLLQRRSGVWHPGRTGRARVSGRPGFRDHRIRRRRGDRAFQPAAYHHRHAAGRARRRGGRHAAQTARRSGGGTAATYSRTATGGAPVIRTAAGVKRRIPDHYPKRRRGGK